MNPLRFLVALAAAIGGWMALMWFALMAVSASPEARHDRAAEPKTAPAANAQEAPNAIVGAALGVRFDPGAARGTAAAATPSVEMAELEQTYMACNREAMARVLGFGEAAQCSVVYERLLAERFGGDFERLLQWSRSTQHAGDKASAAAH